MKLLNDPVAFRAACEQARSEGVRVGLVPTMGALHRGHAELVRSARGRASFVAVSVFVNPTQFGPHEDLARYPRTLDADIEKCAAEGASVVFAPPPQAMYPPGDETRIRPGKTADPFCGPFRPGHFEGVLTVVAKLFALTGPCVAVFGRKDYQQLCVIDRMARDLFFPVEVVSVATVREPDGLALSSRNVYLSPSERQAARAIPRGLSLAVRAFGAGERRAGVLTDLVRAEVAPVATSIDYIDLAAPESLDVFAPDAAVGERATLALAVRIGGTRLIDNVLLGEDAAPITA